MERHEYAVQGDLDLARGNLVRIDGGRGMLVRVSSGGVWITEEGDQRDRFVTAGSQFRVASSGVTLITAISRSTIALSSPDQDGFARRIALVRAHLLARLRARVMKKWKGLYAGRTPDRAERMKRISIVLSLVAMGCASTVPVPENLKPAANESLALLVPAKGVQIYGRHYAGPHLDYYLFTAK